MTESNWPAPPKPYKVKFKADAEVIPQEKSIFGVLAGRFEVIPSALYNNTFVVYDHKAFDNTMRLTGDLVRAKNGDMIFFNTPAEAKEYALKLSKLYG